MAKRQRGNHLQSINVADDNSEDDAKSKSSIDIHTDLVSKQT